LEQAEAKFIESGNVEAVVVTQPAVVIGTVSQGKCPCNFITGS